MGMTVRNGSEFGSDVSLDSNVAIQGGARLGAIRPWFTLLLGITGGAVAIAVTLGLLVLLTTSVARAQPAVDHLRMIGDRTMQTEIREKQAPRSSSPTPIDIATECAADPEADFATDEKTDGIADDPSWQAPRMRQGIRLASTGYGARMGADTGASVGTERTTGHDVFQPMAPEGEAPLDPMHRDVPALARTATPAALQLLIGLGLLAIGFLLLVSSRGSRFIASGEQG